MIHECEICLKVDKAILWKRCEEHYRCDGCGKRKPEVPLCYYSQGVWCPACRAEYCKAKIAAYKRDEFECYYNEDPKCPYCGIQGFDDTWEWGEEGEHQCHNCDSEFVFERHVTYSFSTMRKEAE